MNSIRIAQKTLSKWKENRYTPFLNRLQIDTTADEYVGYLDENNDMCLGKVLSSYCTRKDIRSFFGASGIMQDPKAKELLQPNTCAIQIQIGQTIHGDNSHNILMVDAERVHAIPVPITQQISKYSNHMNGKWIITDEIYNNGYKLCMNGMYYAKNGDWKSFNKKFINKIPVSVCMLCIIWCL